MAPSGRDRDPAFKRRKIVAKPTSKHVDKPKDESTNTGAIVPITPTDSKKETPTPIPVVNPTTHTILGFFFKLSGIEFSLTRGMFDVLKPLFAK